MSKFVELNKLVCGDDGVYRSVEQNRKAIFNYSDGEEIEARLFSILSGAQDLSSSSPELQTHISDWPSEYHLSQTRANLLRPFNFSGVKRVLELGCGCGAISRYLGELEGVEVDSIEGSSARAGLAALRCRDLDNVTISVANFNDAIVPENYYDLILFVGVTEYAGRFSNQPTDQQALQDLLAMAKRASSADGVTLIAIENRLGLKYMLGANEDHYAVRFVGLDNYIDSSGIRTYSKAEWGAEIAQAGYSSQRYVYPFPDYKVPTVMVAESAQPSATIKALEGLNSRDYSAPFDLGESEHRVWQGLLEAGNLADHANSFLLLLSDSEKVLSETCDFDLRAYQMPRFEYLSDARHSSADKSIDALKSKLARLQQHTNNLEQKVALMRSSQGWRLLNMIRRFFGKKTL